MRSSFSLGFSLVYRSFKECLRQRGSLIGTCCFYLLVLFIFSQVWIHAQARDASTLFEPKRMIWYLAITEWILISMPMGHTEIYHDIQNGTFSYLNLRPVSYAYLQICAGLGTMLGRLLCLGVVGFSFTYVLTGGFPGTFASLLVGGSLGVLGSAVGFLFYVAIGLLTFWIWDPAPLSWIWQKCLFIFGGLIFPLSIYPEWLARLSEFTPCAPILNGPANVALLEEGSQGWVVLGSLLVWSGVSLFVIYFVSYLGLRRISQNGD